ncbi:acyl carrier protein [Caulobacter sp. D5]|uniref:acyl carrier protein n=1 Tax=Caulobacter sp. D5 TaxID=357400 RepID=UPI000D72CD4F|nr:acyl carrier protein [Caulobacter sp. D5]PXA96507.1 acyl carrier protein [Caulobacter sp. D5]
MQAELTDSEGLERILKVMRQTFRNGSTIKTITPETTADDVNGWDSLTHTLFIMALEDEFAVTLPIEATLEAANIGDLMRLIAAAQ